MDPPFSTLPCSRICPWTIFGPRREQFPERVAQGKLWALRNKYCPRINITKLHCTFTVTAAPYKSSFAVAVVRSICVLALGVGNCTWVDPCTFVDIWRERMWYEFIHRWNKHMFPSFGISSVKCALNKHSVSTCNLVSRELLIWRWKAFETRSSVMDWLSIQIINNYSPKWRWLAVDI